MGRAKVECASGCTCLAGAGVVDGLWTNARVSITYLHFLFVRPAPRCVLRITVLNETSSGEHKWKLTTLIAKTMAHTPVPHTGWGSLAP